MSNLVLFKEKSVRRTWHNEQWFFSVVDVIEILTASVTPRKYWDALKRREPQLSTICRQLKLESSDGKKYATDCANTEGVLRIIMSVPSPNAEPFKLWMAQVAKDRIDEIETPELAMDRAVLTYKAKGYPEDWIANRIKAISVRNDLTDQWEATGVKEGVEYSILTAEIAKATFGITPSEHKALKGLKNENLRDNMTNLELIFSALGEAVTRIMAEDSKATGFEENREVAVKGGKAAGESLKRLEKVTGKKVVSKNSFKTLKDGDPKALL